MLHAVGPREGDSSCVSIDHDNIGMLIGLLATFLTPAASEMIPLADTAFADQLIIIFSVLAGTGNLVLIVQACATRGTGDLFMVSHRVAP
jgi:hypothetical protein